MPNCDYEIAILRELVSIDTESKKKIGYTRCAKVIEDKMRELGLKVEVFDPLEQIGDDKPRPNVIGTLDVGSEKTIGLIVHYDVVPPGEGWTKDPFKLTVEGDKAYGRGTADDKSAIVACLGALRKIGKKAKFNVKLVASPEEEIGGRWGIGYVMRDLGLRFDYGVVVDAMPNMICIGASGIVQGEIKVWGKQGHAGYPHNANNPIPQLAQLVITFNEYIRQREQKLSTIDAPPGSPRKKIWGRLSFTIIGGGEKENVIPSNAWTRFDMRVLPDESPVSARAEMLEFFNKARQKLGLNAEINFFIEDGGFLTDPEQPFVRMFQDATASVFGKPLPLAASLGGDDGKFLAECGIPVVSYGAIADDSNFHGTDEFVQLMDLENLRDVLVSLIG